MAAVIVSEWYREVWSKLRSDRDGRCDRLCSLLGLCCCTSLELDEAAGGGVAVYQMVGCVGRPSDILRLLWYRSSECVACLSLYVRVVEVLYSEISDMAFIRCAPVGVRRVSWVVRVIIHD